MGNDSPPTNERWLSVRQAAEAWQVNENTVRAWIADARQFEIAIFEQRDTGDGATVLMAPWSAIESAQVLRKSDFLTRAGQHAKHLSSAVEARVIVPSADKDQRFSLRDLAILRAWDPRNAGAQPPVTTGSHTVTVGPIERTAAAPQDGTRASVEPTESVAAPNDRHVEDARPHNPRNLSLVLMRYLRERQSPSDLPDSFWEGPCPEFASPLGVFRYICGGWCSYEAVDEHGKPIPVHATNVEGLNTAIWVRRSAGVDVNADGELVFLDEDPCAHAITGAGLPSPGTVPERFRAANRLYDQAEREWRNEWRRRHRAAPDVHPERIGLDREAVLRRYHDWFQRPSDLPAEFWDTKECPPFDPPTNVVRFYYGGQTRGPDGSVMTRVCRSAGWFLGAEGVETEVPVFLPVDDEFDVEPGVHEAGTAAAFFDEANRAWEAARQEWETQWWLHTRRRTS